MLKKYTQDKYVVQAEIAGDCQANRSMSVYADSFLEKIHKAEVSDDFRTVADFIISISVIEWGDGCPPPPQYGPANISSPRVTFRMHEGMASDARAGTRDGT